MHVEFHAGDLAFDQAFNGAQLITIVFTHQRHGKAACAGAACAANTVDVVFRHLWHVEVDHHGQQVDIDTAGRDVGRYQHLCLVRFEVRQRLGALALALVTVDRRRVDAVTSEFFHQRIGAVFGAAEDQHLVAGVLQQFAEQAEFLVLADFVHLLFHRIDSRVARCHVDFLRLVANGFCQRADFVGEGGREHQVLPLFRQ